MGVYEGTILGQPLKFFGSLEYPATNPSNSSQRR